MFLYKIIVVNIYKSLVFLNGNILYRNKKEAKLHTYLVLTAFTTMNIFSIVSILYFKVQGSPINLVITLIIPIILFLMNYLILYKRKGFESIFSSNLMPFKLAHIIITISYIILSFYFMIFIGNYINEIVTLN